jgi:hypothetical protein
MKRDPNLVRLSRDHHRGLVWAMRLDRELPTASDPQIAAMYGELLAFWQTGLLPHFRTEFECLLARLLRYAAGGADAASQLIDRTQKDHLQLNSLMISMRDSDDLAARRETLARFGALLREHIRWEEASLFEAAQSQLSPEELAALGEDVSERIPEIPPPLPWHEA